MEQTEEFWFKETPAAAVAAIRLRDIRSAVYLLMKSSTQGLDGDYPSHDIQRPLHQMLCKLDPHLVNREIIKMLYQDRHMSPTGLEYAIDIVVKIGSTSDLADCLSVPTTIGQPEKSYVQVAAAEALGKRGDKSAVPALINELTAVWPIVRVAAANSLGSLADSRAASALRNALSDGDNTVRLAAARALNNLGLSRAQ